MTEWTRRTQRTTMTAGMVGNLELHDCDSLCPYRGQKHGSRASLIIYTYLPSVKALFQDLLGRYFYDQATSQMYSAVASLQGAPALQRGRVF